MAWSVTWNNNLNNYHVDYHKNVFARILRTGYEAQTKHQEDDIFGLL